MLVRAYVLNYKRLFFNFFKKLKAGLEIIALFECRGYATINVFEFGFKV